VMIMMENIAGELADLSAAQVELPNTFGTFDTGATIRERYERLWAEINREEAIAPGESFRIHERIRALNALGFSVGEVELVATGERNRLRMRTIVTDRDYHRHQLHTLTGIVAGDRRCPAASYRTDSIVPSLRSVDRICQSCSRPHPRVPRSASLAMEAGRPLGMQKRGPRIRRTRWL